MMLYLFPVAGYHISDALEVGAGLEVVMVGDGQMDGTDVSDSAVNWIEPWIWASYQFPCGMELLGGIGDVVSGKNTCADMDIYIRLNKGFSF